MPIDLNAIQKTKVTTDIGAMNVLIYGPPKVGKTTLAAQIPNAFWLTTERGHNFVEIREQQINKWEDVLEIGKALITQTHGIKTLVIDIADYFFKHCERYVMEKHKVEHPSDLAYGKGFSLVKDEFTRVVTRLNSVGCGMVFISHAKEKTQKTKTGEWTVMGTSMPGTAESLIAGMCDIILYCYLNENNKALMRTKPTKYILAGDRSKRLPELMPLDYKLLTDFLSGKRKMSEKELEQNKKRDEINEKEHVETPPKVETKQETKTK